MGKGTLRNAENDQRVFSENQLRNVPQNTRLKLVGLLDYIHSKTFTFLSSLSVLFTKQAINLLGYIPILAAQKLYRPRLFCLGHGVKLIHIVFLSSLGAPGIHSARQGLGPVIFNQALTMRQTPFKMHC